MKQNKGVGLGWILIFVWIAASIGGILYSFTFLFSAILLGIWALCLWPRTRRKRAAAKELQKIFDWQINGGPRPPEEIFQAAAEWYMQGDYYDLRQEDMQGEERYYVEASVRPYLLSEKVRPRRTSILF